MKEEILKMLNEAIQSGMKCDYSVKAGGSVEESLKIHNDELDNIIEKYKSLFGEEQHHDTLEQQEEDIHEITFED